ncbi:unnamed protein product, partial [Ixodes pacificus]
TDKRKQVDGAEEKGDATAGFQRPPQGVTREAIVVGVDNVPRFARALDREVGDSRRLEVLYNRKATAEVAEKLIEDYESQARKVRRLYVLHVGIKELLQGRRPEEIVDHLRNTWSKRSDVLAICAVPEVATRGKAVQAAAMLLNVKLGDLCQELRATYINLSKDLYPEDMTTDGLHYSQEGGRKVAHRLARVISRFFRYAQTRQKCETNTADQSTESREQAPGDNNARPGDTEPDVSLQLATNCKTGTSTAVRSRRPRKAAKRGNVTDSPENVAHPPPTTPSRAELFTGQPLRRAPASTSTGTHTPPAMGAPAISARATETRGSSFPPPVFNGGTHGKLPTGACPGSPTS